MSKYSKKQKTKKLVVMLISASLIVLIFIILLDTNFVLENIFIFFIAGFLGLYILADRIIDMFFSSWDSFDHYERGEYGEEVVANKLSEIEHSYSNQNVMLPNGKMDIDHIVISRKGIFVIETKNYTGRIEVYGDKWYRTEKRKFGIKSKRKLLPKSPNIQALMNAMKLRKFLLTKLPEDLHNNLFIKPLVVMVNDFNPEDIHTKDKILDIGSLHEEIYSENLQVDRQLLIMVKDILDELTKNKL